MRNKVNTVWLRAPDALFSLTYSSKNAREKGSIPNQRNERKKALEDEYFVKKEKELIEKLQSKLDKESNHCPKCGEPLKERSFQKIAIDQCTGCGGIRLDPAEMEQIAQKDEGSWLRKFWGKEK